MSQFHFRLVFVSGSNELGDFRAGLSAGLVGVLPAVMIGGFGTIAVAALWSWMFPSLRSLDRMSELGEVEKASLAESDTAKAAKQTERQPVARRGDAP